MTVAELVDKLKEMPQDLQVYMTSGEYPYIMDINDVMLGTDDYPGRNESTTTLSPSVLLEY